MATIEGEKFDIGRVVSRAFGAIGRNPVLFVGLALVLEVLPGLVIRGVQMSLATPGQVAPLGVVTIVTTLLGMVFFFVFQAAIVHATAVDLDGGKPAIGASLGLAIRLVLPLAGLAIVSSLGVMFGMMLLFVPGIILAMMWFVAVPALVEERRGIGASLGRSRALTSGSRWRLFALAIVMAILVYLPFVILAFAGGGFMAASLQMAQFSWLTIVLAILNGAVAVVVSAVVAAAYLELRMVKEGATPANLAAIFA